ncbi:hypothetical protein AB0N89_19860 [Amycolatopsis sp. NPDC089917]|uniref:hypothetical protein n=1 Tax=Amycolatopsis sp. NPDC089917 TaxID=3155187 RepID=UPI0034404BFC
MIEQPDELGSVDDFGAGGTDPRLRRAARELRRSFRILGDGHNVPPGANVNDHPSEAIILTSSPPGLS